MICSNQKQTWIGYCLILPPSPPPPLRRTSHYLCQSPLLPELAAATAGCHRSCRGQTIITSKSSHVRNSHSFRSTLTPTPISPSTVLPRRRGGVGNGRVLTVLRRGLPGAQSVRGWCSGPQCVLRLQRIRLSTSWRVMSKMNPTQVRKERKAKRRMTLMTTRYTQTHTWRKA